MRSHLTNHIGKFLLCLVAVCIGSMETVAQDASDAPKTFDARLEVLQKISIPARSQGFLTKANLGSGTIVRKDEVLAELDISKERLEQKRLKSEIAGMEVKLADTAEVVVAEQAFEVADSRLSELQKAMTQTRIPRLEMVEAETTRKSTAASLSGALATRVQLQHSLDAKKAELEMIELKIRDSSIVSPFDGIVFKQFKHPGEAVEQGEALAEIYRLDYLRATVLPKQDEISPQEFLSISGTIEIEFPGGEIKAFQFEEPQTLPRVERDGRFLAVVKVKNRKRKSDDGWQLLPGMHGKLITNRQPNRQPSNLESTSLEQNVAGKD